MKSPIDIVRGRIVDIDERGIVTIKARYDDWPILLKRGYKECNIQMIDSRPLSDKQRRTCYKLIREISNYTGMGLDPTKEYMKLKFLAEDLQATADQMFSLSNAPMSLVCAFQRFLVHFILDWDIPCSFPLLDFVMTFRTMCMPAWPAKNAVSAASSAICTTSIMSALAATAKTSSTRGWRCSRSAGSTTPKSIR